MLKQTTNGVCGECGEEAFTIVSEQAVNWLDWDDGESRTSRATLELLRCRCGNSGHTISDLETKGESSD